MKFTSFTNIVISAAAMAGELAIASNSNTTRRSTPIGRSCGLSMDTYECEWFPNLNNGMPYAVYCGSQGTVESATACGCQTCCEHGGTV
ncbi:uncharacterized protein EDB93DRAFT_1119869 [Suillus bovinus]|uniref:uncharacterized protein n=1 Tax=Suillus bovinus TaxID=48563 RepID=UPI001B87FBFD|nr:uncharacterized protein EDB93DRAFT_1119869 [Suillus bovinus]KAG2158695.1 hypothetical protein EDB93DRAFT_1119869 [Suillus bovinus]